MPLFGSRMVCETANYKHIEETKRKFAQREENLGDWAKEKSERKAALEELKLQTKQIQASESRSRGGSRKNSLVSSGAETNREMVTTVTTPLAEEGRGSGDMTVPDINIQEHCEA